MMLPQNSELIEYKLTQIQEDIEGLKTDVSSIKQDLANILTAIQGNPLIETDGISGRLIELEEKVKDNEEFIKKVRFVGVIVVFLGGLVGWGLNFFFGK